MAKVPQMQCLIPVVLFRDYYHTTIPWEEYIPSHDFMMRDGVDEGASKIQE